MRHRILVLSAILINALFTPTLAAQPADKAEVARRAKLATVFVEVDGTFKQGSAFCIHESGFFLTNQHVVSDADGIKLVLNPGLKDMKAVAARVVRTDRDLDLALLKVDEKMVFTPLPLGSVEGLVELSEVIAIGFPFGKSLSVEKGEYPAVSLNAGHVTSLRNKNGELDRIQIDAGVNPGNSGGPVVDSQGKVVGVVVSGVRGTTVNFAIPVSHVQRFVAMPEVEVSAPTIDYVDRHKPAEFKVRTVALVPGKRDYDVEFRIGRKDKQRVLTMKPEDGAFHAITSLVSPTSGPRVAVIFDGGRIEGHVEDRIFTMGTEKIKLSTLRSLKFQPVPSAELADTKIVRGAIADLDELAIALGTASVKVDVRTALELTVAPPADDSRVEYTIVVRENNKELARVQESFVFRNAPTSGGIDLSVELKKLQGLWILDKAEANGGSYPHGGEEALLIEGKQIIWVKADGKTAPGHPKGQFSIDPTTKPMSMDLRVNNTAWQAIYKIEGNRLTIGTNCNDERRPAEFTTRLFAGADRSTFLRTYKRQASSE